jgi:phosphonate transport system substrate-binding protein
MIRGLMVLLALVLCFDADAAGSAISMRIGVTPAILHDDHGAMFALRHYLEKKTGWIVELVPSNSYRQTMDMIKRGDLDFAWVSAFPYVYLHRRNQARLVAMPVMNGSPTFRAYLIVPAEDQSTRSIEQLEGKVFAYADPYSLTGYVVPRYEILQAGKDAKRFFARTIFTSGHKNVIRAVASGLADGGSVDSFVWDSLARIDPGLIAKTRIVSRSAEFGSPPIVAGRTVKPRDLLAMRRVLLQMASDPSGIDLLKRLHVDEFIAGDPKAFSSVEAMMKATGDL